MNAKSNSYLLMRHPKKKFLLILMLQQKQVLPILTVAVKKLTSIPNIFLIPLSSVTIINLHRPQPLQLLNLREIHTTRCLSMEVPALVKPILCIPSLIILLSTMKTAKFCMLPVKNWKAIISAKKSSNISQQISNPISENWKVLSTKSWPAPNWKRKK